jgi:hypothetical protein
MHRDRCDRFGSRLNICLEACACCYRYGDQLFSSAILMLDFSLISLYPCCYLRWLHSFGALVLSGKPVCYIGLIISVSAWSS